MSEAGEGGSAALGLDVVDAEAKVSTRKAQEAAALLGLSREKEAAALAESRANAALAEKFEKLLKEREAEV